MDKLNFQTRLLLSLFNGRELNRGFRAYDNLYCLFSDRNQGTIRVLLDVLLKSASVEKVEKNNKVGFCLNSVGRKNLLGPYLEKLFVLRQRLLASGRQIIPGYHFSDTAWNRVYSLIVVSVPEKERKYRLRIKELLFKSGFRLWQQSIWVSPLSHKKVFAKLEKEGLINYVALIKALGLFDFQKESAWIYDLWNLGVVRKKYLALIKSGEILCRKMSFDVAGYGDLENWQLELLENISLDPFLPNNFFDLRTLREKNAELFFALSEKEIL